MSRRWLAAALAALVFTGCAANDAPKDQEQKTLTVFAAASLKGAFDKISEKFEADHPGVDVAVSYQGSSTLVDQLEGGAPADVFASADEKNMTRAEQAEVVTGTPKVFASNILTLIVAPDNPLGITGMDQSLEGHKLVVCAEGVPCGNATKSLAEKLGVTLSPVSEEQKVTDVVGKVTSGEADAGVVYTTDAAAAGDKATAVAIKDADQVVNRYPIARTKDASQPELADAFIQAVTDEAGQKVLQDFGFGKP